MSILYYPAQGNLDNRRPGESAGWTYAFFYRLYQNSVWGPEKKYVQGTNLGLSNTSGSTISVTVEYITRVYYGGEEDLTQTERRTEIITLLPVAVAGISGLAVFPSMGPLEQYDTFDATTTISNTGVPGVYVLTYYDVYDGPTFLFTVPIGAVEVSPGVWSATSALPMWEAFSLQYRDILVRSILYESGGTALGAASLFLDDYWRSVVVLPPATADEFTFEEIMSNYSPSWMNANLLPGTRHSVRPTAPNVSVDDLYLIDIKTVPEEQPGVILHTQVLPVMTDPAWTVTPPHAAIDIDLTALVGRRLRSVIVEFDDPLGTIQGVEITVSSIGGGGSRVFDEPGSYRFHLQEVYDVSAAYIWSFTIVDYIGGDPTAIQTGPITVTFIGV